MTFNSSLAQEVVAQILATPEKHVQADWRCGTGFCFAGWVAELQEAEWADMNPNKVMGDFIVVPRDSEEYGDYAKEAWAYLGDETHTEVWGRSDNVTSKGRALKPNDKLVHVSDYAAAELGLSRGEASYFFSGDNSRSKLQALVKAHTNGDPEEIKAALNYDYYNEAEVEENSEQEYTEKDH
jgi:hypothetical protein